MAKRGTGSRDLAVRVKSARKRKPSSARWLERQLNDPYVARAKREGYRSRSAYKLIEIDDRYGLLKPGSVVVDLGAAPGGWSQVAAARTGAAEGLSKVIALDILPMDPIAGVTFLQLDFLEPEALDALAEALGGEKATLVLSDMAAATIGHRRTDALRTEHLYQAAAEYAVETLAEGGDFLAKVFRGGAESSMLADLKRRFRTVTHVKPKASRPESVELYLLARGFKGG